MKLPRLITTRYAVLSVAVLLVSCLIVAAVIGLRTYLRPMPTYADYEEMINNGELIGLSLQDAKRRIRATWRRVDSDTAEFYLPHLDLVGGAWITVQIQDGVIDEATIYSD